MERTKIEALAIRYIQTRRGKLNIKAKRRDSILKCAEVNSEFGSCFKDESLDFDDWCDHCQEAARYHKEFTSLDMETRGLLRRLENAVKKGE